MPPGVGSAHETRDLERFYESVRMRARGLDNSAARQHVLMELYEKFFATAMKKDANRLGIVIPRSRSWISSSTAPITGLRHGLRHSTCRRDLLGTVNPSLHRTGARAS